MLSSYYFLTNQLSEDETRIITCIVNHLERNEERVSITQVAEDNYVSTSFIIKMCKRLGFSGYSELLFSLKQKVRENAIAEPSSKLGGLIDNYTPELVDGFCRALASCRTKQLFVVGAGFADFVADYIVQRLGVSGFIVSSRVHFYDYMLFRDDREKHIHSNVEPSLIIAISQSGESEAVVQDVERAKQNGFEVALFTKKTSSTIADIAEHVFVVDGTKQTLISTVPNEFFGKVILAFEQVMGIYFEKMAEGTLAKAANPIDFRRLG